jgi:tripartite-type tricarboxylate transporter receptor subunit TctC
MSQRRSNASPAERALASARNSIELSLLTALPHARAESLRADAPDTRQGTRQDAQPGTQEETQPDDDVGRELRPVDPPHLPLLMRGAPAYVAAGDTDKKKSEREKTMISLRTWHLAGAVLLAMPQVASAQASPPWPERTIQAIVPFAAGAANDIVGRIVLEQVSKQVNQPIVVENRPGAGGTIGVTAVGKAQPNGHTLLVHSSSFSAAYSLYKSLPYDTLNDFTAVVALGKTPTVLVTSPGKGFKTAADLIAAAKAKPGAMNFASAGIGSVSHLAAERFRLSAGIDAQHIPFRGPNEAFTEVMAGRIDFYFLPLAPALPLVKEGQLVALAVSTDTRATALPDVPTTMELGLKDSAYLFWTGIFVPAKTPRDIVDRIHSESIKAMQVPVVQERLAKVGSEPMPMSVDEFGKYFRDDVLATAKLMQQVGVKPGD